MSNSTDWSKIDKIMPELIVIFNNFSLEWYSGITEGTIDNKIIPWFKSKRAGSMTMKQDLKNLIKTKDKLNTFS
mgnify:CR=1 FL=1